MSKSSVWVLLVVGSVAATVACLDTRTTETEPALGGNAAAGKAGSAGAAGMVASAGGGAGGAGGGGAGASQGGTTSVAGAGTGGGGTGGSTGGSGGSSTAENGFTELVSKELFNSMFPDRNSFYTYEGLVAAVEAYPAFAATGDVDTRKREAAAFLANMARETGELVYIEQIEKDVYCEYSAKYPCAAGKQYYGRGPIQISWNYNYGAAGEELGYDLLNNPDLVAQDATVAWETGLWFWMTRGGDTTCHEAITQGSGFGKTIDIINGAQECNGAWPEAVQARVDFYESYCAILGVTPGDYLYC